MIVYISRDGSGNISGVFANLQSGYAEEQIDNADSTVVAFLNPPILDNVDHLDIVALKVLFNHENRIRALESKAPITMAQFKTALRAL